MFLDKDLQEKIRKANVSVHQIESKSYELIHPEIYSRHEQERLQYALKMVDKHITVNRVREKTALDVGAGTGNITGKLLQMGYQVTALDISAEMCNILKKKYPSNLNSQKLSVVNSPIEDVHFDGNFDLITCYSVLHHIPNYLDALQRFSGFLKRGGMIYLDHEASPFYWSEATNLEYMVKSVYVHSVPLINGLYFRVAGMVVPSIDYEMSDYWYNTDHHLNHEKIKKVFEKESFEFFKRTDYFLQSRTWVPNPLFPLYRRICKPDMSLWIAKK